MSNNIFFSSDRRPTHCVKVSSIGVGALNPIRIQSMTNTDPLNVEATYKQIKILTDAGAEIIRITIPSVIAAEKLEELKNILNINNIQTPLVADIHFNPKAALIAAKWVDKVRINPGNYAEKNINMETPELSIKAELTPLINQLKKENKSLRIGVNHGSLSERMISKYGNTVQGMVHSAMEYLYILRDLDFDQTIVSMKSSNPIIMVDAYRLLIKEMNKEGFTNPLHLGVTEAGSGIEGLIKSASGLAPLLFEGIGDTLRVSLTEPPENEIIPACNIINQIELLKKLSDLKQETTSYYSNTAFAKDIISPFISVMKEFDHNFSFADSTALIKDNSLTLCFKNNKKFYFTKYKDNCHCSEQVLSVHSPGCAINYFKTYNNDQHNFIIHYKSLTDNDLLKLCLEISILFFNGIKIKGILIPEYDREVIKWIYAIFQSLRLRITSTEFTSCPTCGRTSFDLLSLSETVKSRLSHLKGLKIAIMGCIVNGPGEMADADYGVIGRSKDKVTLFRGKKAEKTIPLDKACEELINMIKEDKRWHN